MLGLRPDGYARVLAADDQLFEEHPIADQMLLKFFYEDPANKHVIFNALKNCKIGIVLKKGKSLL